MDVFRRVPHTAQQMQKASNLAHWIIGALFGIVGVLALGSAASDNARVFHLWWSGTLTILGILLTGFIVFHHGLRMLPSWLADLAEDPQQRQHLTMGVLATVGGAAEFALAARGGAPVLGFVWPAALGIVGGMFVAHTQHGTHAAVDRALRYHRVLGGTLIAAALSALLDVLSPAAFWTYLWPLIVLLAASLLISYREPEGAWEGPEERHAAHEG